MDGIIPLWKEKGMTSFDCVFQVRRLLQTKKVGHSGTLDPQVDGVLPICIGKATKVVEYLLESNKVYQGEITMGVSTETEDAYGSVIEQVPVTVPVPTAQIDQVMHQMTGTLTQIPPMYSAVKVNGKRLYEYARQGITMERPSRTVQIFSFQRTNDPIYDEARQTQSWQFEVSCSKGTYIRTLAVDLGKQLGFPAHMSQLTRVKSGAFQKEDCITLDQLETLLQTGQLSSRMKPIDWALKHYPKVTVSDSLAVRVHNGAVISRLEWPAINQPTRVYDQHQLIALYDVHPKNQTVVKPVKMF